MKIRWAGKATGSRLVSEWARDRSEEVRGEEREDACAAVRSQAVATRSCWAAAAGGGRAGMLRGHTDAALCCPLCRASAGACQSSAPSLRRSLTAGAAIGSEQRRVVQQRRSKASGVRRGTWAKKRRLPSWRPPVTPACSTILQRSIRLPAAASHSLQQPPQRSTADTSQQRQHTTPPSAASPAQPNCAVQLTAGRARSPRAGPRGCSPPCSGR